MKRKKLKEQIYSDEEISDLLDDNYDKLNDTVKIVEKFVDFLDSAIRLWEQLKDEWDKGQLDFSLLSSIERKLSIAEMELSDIKENIHSLIDVVYDLREEARAKER